MSFIGQASSGHTYIDELDTSIFPFIAYEGYEDRYPARTILERPDEFYAELRQASLRLFEIFCRTVKVFQQCPDDFMELIDIPQELRPFLHIPNPLGIPTFLSRFDFILDQYGRFKVIEINADTPCAIVEAYYGNGVAAAFSQRRDPNEGQCRDLQKLLQEVRRAYPEGPFTFSCFHDYIEDYATTMFLKKCAPPGVPPYMEQPVPRFVSFYDLAVSDEGILLPSGAYAGILYRLHPLELLINEIGDDGYPLGKKVLELYKQGKVGLFNPPESIIMQSKGFQALVWALYETADFFSPEERDTIANYMVPSFFEEDRGRLTGLPYIRKPIWGREGNGMAVYDAAGRLETSKVLQTPNEVVERPSQASLYQQFVESNAVSIETDSGFQQGYLTYSCFMTGKSPSAVYCRFSPDKIAGVEAYWVPLVCR